VLTKTAIFNDFKIKDIHSITGKSKFFDSVDFIKLKLDERKMFPKSPGTALFSKKRCRKEFSIRNKN
jgi:hypothetical protein